MFSLFHVILETCRFGVAGLHRFHWNDICHIGMCIAGIWCVVAILCSAVLRIEPDTDDGCTTLHRQCGWNKLHLHGECHIHDHGFPDQLVCSTDSTGTCRHYCIGSMFFDIGWQCYSISHHPRILYNFRLGRCRLCDVVRDLDTLLKFVIRRNGTVYRQQDFCIIR